MTSFLTPNESDLFSAHESTFIGRGCNTELVMLNKPKQSQETKILQYQDRIPYFGDDYYEQANILARSGLYRIKTDGSYYTDYTPMCLIGPGDLFYMGHQLEYFDECLFLNLIYLMRGQSLIKPIEASKRQLLLSLGLSQSSKYYKDLDDSIKRLESGKIKISSRPALSKLFRFLTDSNFLIKCDPEFGAIIKERYGALAKGIAEAISNNEPYYLTIGFIQNTAGSSKRNKILIYIDPLMTLLFDGVNTVRVSQSDREKISPSASRLLSFFLTHSKGVYDISIGLYRDILGSQIHDDNQFTCRLTRWIKEIEKVGRIRKGWKIVDGKVTGVYPIPYAD